ncbi:MAG: Xaa-Pro peptidase family protein [Gemmataceae bacterium]|nr:Xaa-Pro peptidase family protein [Gemmataceae bacterium]
MLSSEGCRVRRERFWDRFPRLPDRVVLADPHHLRYLAGCYVSPISLGGDFLAALELTRDGGSTLIHDGRLPASVEEAHVDTVEKIAWYDGQSPGRGPRQIAFLDQLPSPPVDTWGSPTCREIVTGIAELRRQKDPDEIALIRTCCRVAEAGLDWGLHNATTGMSELDVYGAIHAACERVAGQVVIVYGDFAVSPGPERRGGPPTSRVLAAGDLLILDYSVILGGYRSDFTNTVCVGREPTPEQQRLLEVSLLAMASGEAELRAGAACQAVYDAVCRPFREAGLLEWFPHHAGHGLGLMHPEAPYFVRHSTEILLENDVVTLEPGLYIPELGGLRIEHNYRITRDGFERLSRHRLALRP